MRRGGTSRFTHRNEGGDKLGPFCNNHRDMGRHCAIYYIGAAANEVLPEGVQSYTKASTEPVCTRRGVEPSSCTYLTASLPPNPS